MKKNLIKKITCLVALGAVLAWAGGVSRADNVIDYQDVLNSGSSSPWWINGWGGQGGGSGGDLAVGNPAGSFWVYDNLSASASSDQWVSLGWYSGSAWNNPTGGSTNLLLYTNIVFDVLWDTADSTMSIDAFNHITNGTSPADLWQVWAIGAGNTWITLGQVLIPDAASNGWATVNLPINNTIAGIDVTWGLGFKKWTGTGHTGVGAFWIDNIGLQRSGTPPPPPTLSPLTGPPLQGLNLYATGGAGDRQNIATIVTNGESYAWVGNPTPVTYSVTIAQFPTNNGFQAHIMLMPGNNITENAPDWNEANALVLFIANQTNGTVLASLRYKLNNPGANSYLFGSDTNIFGGQGAPFTNTIVAGYGGLLGTVTNASGAVGTWSITISGDTNITLNAPDGSTSTMAFPPGDESAFAYPLTVFWGQQANTAGLASDVVFSSVSITGSTNSLNVNLTQPLDPTKMAMRGANNSMIFATPTNAVYWLQWTLPDVGYVLQSASSLMGPWSKAGPAIAVTNYQNTFGDAGSFTNANRTWNPPPMWVGYDGGNATTSSVVWASSPTNALQLDWTWNYTANGAGAADFTADVFASGVDCSGGTLSFDIMLDPSSTAGGSGDYGYFQVISRDGSYTWNDTGYGSGLLAAAGGSVDNWAHVSIPLTGAASTVRALTFHFYNDAGRAIDGPETVYIDNLQISVVGIGNPTVYTIAGKHSVYITSDLLPSSGAGFFRLARPY
jgi:hypothetical protein